MRSKPIKKIFDNLMQNESKEANKSYFVLRNKQSTCNGAGGATCNGLSRGGPRHGGHGGAGGVTCNGLGRGGANG